MQKYLEACSIIDWQHPAVMDAAERIAGDLADPLDIAESCFVWVRDEIRHSGDHQEEVLPGSASEVLEERSGSCFGKSHLLAALLRARGVPAGLCYQRLSLDDAGPPFGLHGLVAVHLPEHGWYRVDPRGNKPGVRAEFMPPTERLAFSLTIPGEADLPEIWPEPLPLVVSALRGYASYAELWANLPDIELIADE